MAELVDRTPKGPVSQRTRSCLLYSNEMETMPEDSVNVSIQQIYLSCCGFGLLKCTSVPTECKHKEEPNRRMSAGFPSLWTSSRVIFGEAILVCQDVPQCGRNAWKRKMAREVADL